MNIITDKAFAPAREMIQANLKRVMRGDIKIGDGTGGHTPGNPTNPNKMICIMEATAFILGYPIDDSPPCSASSITSLLIEVNDMSITMRKRAMLKAVIPDIINTAPTIWEDDTRKKRNKEDGTWETIVIGTKLVTAESDPRFIAAENQRNNMIHDWQQENSTEDTNWDERLMKGNLTMVSFIEFIHELAAVAKFDTQNEATDVEPFSAPTQVTDENPENSEDIK